MRALLTLSAVLAGAIVVAGARADMTGDWTVYLDGHPPAVWSFVQTPPDLLAGTAGAPVSQGIAGEIDVLSGLFRVFAGDPFFLAKLLEATLAPGGNSFAGVLGDCTLVCEGPIFDPLCFCTGTGELLAARGCRVGPAGDGDGDGVCDAIDLCTGGAAFTALRLDARRRALDAPARVTVRAAAQFPAALALDPVADGLRLTLTGADGSALVDLVVPPGAGWKVANGGARATFRSTSGMVRKVSLRMPPRRPGLVKIALTADGVAFDGAAYAAPGHVVLDLNGTSAAAGECADARMAAPGATCSASPNGRRFACR